MTVQELIRILQTLDPDEEVRIDDPFLPNTTHPLNDVELRGPSSNIPVLVRGIE
jgi:hypothetical protein